MSNWLNEPRLYLHVHVWVHVSILNPSYHCYVHHVHVQVDDNHGFVQSLILVNGPSSHICFEQLLVLVDYCIIVVKQP